jgi:hypothetical protein
MALYWPEQKVALQIDDDPLAQPFDGPGDWTVIHATVEQMADFDSFTDVATQVYDALGAPLPPQSEAGARRKLFETLSANTADEYPGVYPYKPMYQGETSEQLNLSSWKKIPKGSMRDMGNGVSMSTPEFHYLRKASDLKVTQLAQLGMELCGFYGTDHQTDPRDYRMYETTVTDVDELRHYLRDARGLPGYKNAMKALNYVVEEASSPVATYMTLLLTLPRHLGGYDLFRPQLSFHVDARIVGAGQAPAADGPYEEYDLCWPRQGVVAQFVGNTPPTPRERRALAAPDLLDMFVVCLTLSQIADEGAFDEAARLIANKIGCEVPPDDASFRSARAQLREDLVFPHYDHMRAMSEDWHCHNLV